MSDGAGQPPGGRLPEVLRGRLALPVICAPMFIVSGPDLVIAQCRAGVVGAFPALNARPPELLDQWLSTITDTLAQDRAADPSRPIAPFAVNQIVHASNDRLVQDVEACVRHRVPIIITSLRAPDAVIRPVHAYGGVVFHDVTTVRHAEKALEAGVDGLILVCAGAGGHAGMLSPFALVAEIRRWFDGPLALSGAIATGGAVAAARAMGADFGYIGSAFIATEEANADAAYKAMVTESSAEDIVYTNLFTGVHGNYLKGSIARAGLDPANLATSDPSKMNFNTTQDAKAWRDIWGCGQGIGAVHEVVPVARLVERLVREYREAAKRLG